MLLVDKDDNELHATFDNGELMDGKFVLGDKENEPELTTDSIQQSLKNLEFSNKQIETISDAVTAMGVGKASTLNINLDVEYDEDNAANNAIELPWFDMIRVNYKIDGGRYILGANANDDIIDKFAEKRTNTITALYNNIDLADQTKESTLSVNEIEFTTFSLDGDIDNRITIDSIELLRSSKNKNKGCLTEHIK